MKKRFFFLLNVVLILSLLVVSPASAKDLQKTLKPCEQVTFEHRVPINIVFIGYDRQMVDQQAVLDELLEDFDPKAQRLSEQPCSATTIFPL